MHHHGMSIRAPVDIIGSARNTIRKHQRSEGNPAIPERTEKPGPFIKESEIVTSKLAKFD